MAASDRTSKASESLHHETENNHCDGSPRPGSMFPGLSPDKMKEHEISHLAGSEDNLRGESPAASTLSQKRDEFDHKIAAHDVDPGSPDTDAALLNRMLDLKQQSSVLESVNAALINPTPLRSDSTASESQNFDCAMAVPVRSPHKLLSDRARSTSKPRVTSSNCQRNLHSRIDDVKLATEISTSLLGQVRDLQVALADKDEALKTAREELSQAQSRNEAIILRLRSLDESEQRLTEENWTLETQLHEQIALRKEVVDQHSRLLQSLNQARSEQSELEKEFEELKEAHESLSSEHTSLQRLHDSELANMSKSLSASEAEREDLNRKIDELRSQNQDLVRAMYQLGREQATIVNCEKSDEENVTPIIMTPEHSPAASPAKMGTPRHGHLESETLKTSLNHALRMIQILKSNTHKERSDKLELRRLLHEARDELEARNFDALPAVGTKKRKPRRSRSHKREKDNSSRGPGSITIVDEGWEDQEQSEILDEDTRIKTRARLSSPRSEELSSPFWRNVLSESLGSVDRQAAEPPGTLDSASLRAWSPALDSSYSGLAVLSDDELSTIMTPTREKFTTRRRTSHKNGSRFRGSQGSVDGTRRPENDRLTWGSPESMPSVAQSTPSRVSRPIAHSLFSEIGTLIDEESGLKTEPALELGFSTPPDHRLQYTLSRTASEISARSLSDVNVRSKDERGPDPPARPHLNFSKMLMISCPPVGSRAEEPQRSDLVMIPTIFTVDSAPEPAKMIIRHPSSSPWVARDVLGRDGRDVPAEKNLPHENLQVSPIVSTDSPPQAGVVKFKSPPNLIISPPSTLNSITPEATILKLFLRQPATQVPPHILSHHSRSLEDVSAGRPPNHVTDVLTRPKSQYDILDLDPLGANSVKNSNAVESNVEAIHGSRASPVSNRRTPDGSPTHNSDTIQPVHKEIPHRPEVCALSPHSHTETNIIPSAGSLPGLNDQMMMPKSPFRHQSPDAVCCDGNRLAANRNQASRIEYSRHPSVSSFVSEIDKSFNLSRPEYQNTSRFGASGLDWQGAPAATDPRMIQAITQTMIGEWLWKYTRKTCREEMSGTRHRRFFWVHPYTRTLYWSQQDPSTAGRVQLKAKSVAIEAVRVVTDDNPVPSGLHHKSLVIITPGRLVKFTTTTGHRHETWFNSLSYLLLRAEDVPTENGQSNNQSWDQGECERMTDDLVHEAEYPYSSAPNSYPESRDFGSESLSHSGIRPGGSDSYTADQGIGGVGHQSAQSLFAVQPSQQKILPRLPGSNSGGLSSQSSHRTLRCSSSWKRADDPNPPVPGTSGPSRNEWSGPIPSGINTPAYARAHGGHCPETIQRPERGWTQQVVFERSPRRTEDFNFDMIENVRACCDGKHDVRSMSRTSKRADSPSSRGGSNFLVKPHTRHKGSNGSSSGPGQNPQSMPNQEQFLNSGMASNSTTTTHSYAANLMSKLSLEAFRKTPSGNAQG